jgi:peptidyl-prolyl cis-trans isomerase C
VKINTRILGLAFCGAITAAALLTGISHSQDAKGDKILAKVGNQTITEADLNKMANAVPERLRYIYLTPEGKQQTLDYIVNVYVLAAQAQTEGLDKDPQFAHIMAFTTKDLLARLYLQKMAKDVPEPTDKEVQQYYETNKDQYAAPESIHLRHILVKTDKEADDVLKRLKKGEKFADIAAQASTCPSKVSGGDLDWLPRGRLVKELEDVAFGMEKGQLSAPVKTRFGFHILLLEDKRPASTSSLDEVKEYIVEQLRFANQQEQYQKLADSLKQKMNVQVTPIEGAAPQAQPGAPAAPPAVAPGPPPGPAPTPAPGGAVAPPAGPAAAPKR